ncbi:hypothetical protein HanPSC8_Chr05g0199701 [Helianthus annuus]|nr:hypothetical protein HanPSC8_Chr05g0199701 [Helianthus annuus]
MEKYSPIKPIFDSFMIEWEAKRGKRVREHCPLLAEIVSFPCCRYDQPKNMYDKGEKSLETIIPSQHY